MAGLHAGVSHTNKAQSLTVLGGSVSEHHPQVTPTHVFNGDCHLAGSKEKSGELWAVNTGLYVRRKCYQLGDLYELHILC